MLEDTQVALTMSLSTNEELIRALEEAGYRSIFDIARQPEKRFCAEFQDLLKTEVKEVHALATQRVTNLLSLYRTYQSRGEPLLQRVPKLGVNPRPTELASAVQRSLGGVPDFDDLFPERSDEGYAEAASIQSLFSPGRYLTELYKVSRGLHKPTSPLNIDQRRPDIASMLLTQQNMIKEVSTLEILNYVLHRGIERHASTTMTALETTYYPMTLPYQDSLTQIRCTFSAQNTSLQHVWSVLSDHQARAFLPIVYLQPVDPLVSINTPFPATREELELAPATYALLTGDPATSADIQRDYHLPSADIASELRTVDVFIDRTGLTFNELVDLTAQIDPEGEQQNASRYYRFEGATTVPVTEYGQCYIATANSTPTPLLIVPGEMDYAQIGSVYNVEYVEDSQLISVNFTLSNLFRGADGENMFTLEGPEGTFMLVAKYDDSGNYLSSDRHPPPSFTGRVFPQLAFAGGPYKQDGQMGASGGLTSPIRLAPFGQGLQLRLTPTTAVPLADRAERLIRLQRQVEIEFHELDWLIKHANLAWSSERKNCLMLDQPVLSAVAEFMRLRDGYGISSDAFTTFIGAINVYAPANQLSLYEKLFTSDTTGLTVPLNATINFGPETISDYQSIVAGALGINENELYAMAQIAFDTPNSVTMNECRYAQLYRLAMIPKLLGVTFAQARVLWLMLDPDRDIARIIGREATLETLDIIRQMEVVLHWMATNKLNIDYCFQLVTDQYSQSVTPELYNYAHNIYISLSNDDAATHYQPKSPLTDSLRQKLYALTATVFKVKPNVMGCLIQWIDKNFISCIAGPDGTFPPYGLGDFWTEIDMFFSNPAAQLAGMNSVPDVARYCQALAQFSAIALWSNLSEQDLNLVVETPEWFMGPVVSTQNRSPHSLRELLYIARLKQWQQRVTVSEAEAMSYFRYSNTVYQTAEEATAMLAYIFSWDPETTLLMNNFLVVHGAYAEFPKTFIELNRLESWMSIGLKNLLAASTVDALYRMSLNKWEAEFSYLIRETSEQIVANLNEPYQVQEIRRDALVAYYIAYCISDMTIDGGVPLSMRIKNANDLYEYLLIDTQITAAVTTSWVAEAIASLQLYIGRCLAGYDPDVDNSPGSTMTQESRPGGFLYDWPQYNHVYSTWAGKERLQYYPSIYVHPGLRYDQTEQFGVLEETINQGRIAEQRVETAFQQYIQGFEAVATLLTISGYQAGTNYTRETHDTFYFIGRSQNASPYSYYWRSCQMSKRNDLGNLTTDAWSQWHLIKAPVSEAMDDQVRPCWHNGRLYIGWVSGEKNGQGSEDIKYFSNIWGLLQDGNWVAYRKEQLSRKPELFGLYSNLDNGNITFWWPTKLPDGGRNEIYGDQRAPQNKAKVNDRYYFNDIYYVRIVDINDTQLTVQYSITGYPYGKTIDYIERGNADYIPSQGYFGIEDGNIGEFSISYLRRLDLKFSGGDRWANIVVAVEPEARFMIENGWVKYMVDGAVTEQMFYLCTNAGPYFSRLLQYGGPDALLAYSTQTSLIELDGTKPIDFNGSYGLYFWEIFFHCSFLLADRYLIEQNYTQSQRWYQYIFNPAGYRDRDGELETINGTPRYWNTVPLQEDHTWSLGIPPTVDPDMIAMNDPMHYKMAIFLNSVNGLIEQGDNAYRMLQRDYLAQAKMYYLQAAQMLGPRPHIDYKARWPNPSVAEEAGAIVILGFDNPDALTRTPLTQLLAAYLTEQNGDFLPPYNTDLLVYWDKLELRFYNLRHNLSLSGQPLALPLYAEPVSPRDLQLRRMSAGDGPGGNSVRSLSQISQYRFSVLLELAKAAVSDVRSLGSSLQAALETRDEKNMDMLLRTQRQRLLQMTADLESTDIAVLQNELTASHQALAGSKKRLSHYSKLYENWISPAEEASMGMRTMASYSELMSMPFTVTEKSSEMVPNIFGLAAGGSKYGALFAAFSSIAHTQAATFNMIADRIDISEEYRRRRQDWQIERDNAESEIAELEATIQAQTLRVSMARKQLALTQQELADEMTTHSLLEAAFTGLQLYNWMSGRLASLYYQFYSSTLSLCLGCKDALAREIGPSRGSTLFTAPMWNDLYQGLLAGEGLLLELRKMENIYVQDDRRGLEIVRAVSLNKQIQDADTHNSLSKMIDAALHDKPTPAKGGVEVNMTESSELLIKLSLDVLGLNSAYASNNKVGRLKNISVTLTPEVAADQDLQATLTLGNTYVALSHGVDDSGVFELKYDDARYLPFEGEPTMGALVLTFIGANSEGIQRQLVESLTNVTYQIRYTLKEY